MARAYAACERLARSHYENFPVASRLLPAAMRPHVAAVYAFARIADDIADEGTATPDDRQARLRDWQCRLHRAIDRQLESHSPDVPLRPEDHDLLFVAIAHTIRSHNLPIALFDDLISAFGQDTMTSRYDSWTELLDYCRRSANPIGRLVLRIAGRTSAMLDRSSDGLCTALQLTNFWQDFARDWHAGRLYVPREVTKACGAGEELLPAPSQIASAQAGPRLPDAWADAIGRCVDVTRRLFAEGRPVCDGVGGRLRYELRLTWLGGRRILDRVDATRFELLRHRPTLGAVDMPVLAWQAARWRASRGMAA